MDFPFNISAVLKDEITEVDSSFKPCRNNGIDRQGFRQLKDMLFEIIDKMGDASARAQGLHGSITSGKKLECTNHRLYIIKDTQNSSSSHGSVIGILKVGNKKLFVYDSSKVQHELEPLCVLDFYVHESRQRMGCGKKLFEFMLQNERIPAQCLAIDRPSPKFLSFLRRHYGLEVVIPQVNNFVIFEGFFRAKSEKENKSIRPGIISSRPPSGSRHPQRVPSALLDNVHLPNINNKYVSPGQQAGDYNWTVSGISSDSQSHLGAAQKMYSRHGLSSLSNISQYNSMPARGYTPTRQQTSAYQIYDAQRQAIYSRESVHGGSSSNLNSQQGQVPNVDNFTTPSAILSSRAGSGDSYGVSRLASSSPVMDPRYPKGFPPSHPTSIPTTENLQQKFLEEHYSSTNSNYQNLVNKYGSIPQEKNGIQPGILPTGNPMSLTPGLASQVGNRNTSWTVMGVLREQRLAAPVASRYQNRLW